MKPVVSVPPCDQVIACAAPDPVCLPVTPKVVIEARALQILYADIGVPRRLAGVQVGKLQIRKYGGSSPPMGRPICSASTNECVGALTSDEHVVAVISIQCIVASPTVDNVVAATSPDDVALRITAKVVAMIRPDKVLDFEIRIPCSFARAKVGILQVCAHCSFSQSVGRNVRALTSDKVICTQPAQQNIVAYASEECVGAIPAHESVSPVCTGDHIG